MEHVKVLNPYTDVRAWETSTPNQIIDAYLSQKPVKIAAEEETMFNMYY